MAFKIDSLDRLIDELGRLPGLGEKSAQRLAFHLLKHKEDSVPRLAAALEDVRRDVHNCPVCFNYTDQELCAVCADPNRQRDVICVVEDPGDILRIEAAMQFKGLYHVLQGVLSPLDGIGPDQIKLTELMKRLEESVEPVTEVILALDADLEGDATSLYMTKLIKQFAQTSNRQVRVTRIAHGVPIGGHLEYVDYRTLSRALENRVEL